MAGASISFDYKIDDREVIALFDRLIQAGESTEEVFQEIGEHLLISHPERWANEESPDGDPWAPLNPEYQSRKKKNADKILTLEGYLRDSLSYDTSVNSLEFGTNSIYGATHQFGDDDRNIPAREYLGISTDDEAAILEILHDHVATAIS